MASEIDICNLALARLGDSATVSSISPPEGSAQAEHCKRFYPIARDALLELHDWHFATRRKALAAIAGDWDPWAYAYAPPADCMRVIAIVPPESPYSETQPYERELGPVGEAVILTDQEEAVARYVAKVTDTTRFSPLFVDVLAWVLASHLAGPLLKGDAGIKMTQQCYQVALAMLARATASDANQRKSGHEHTPAWISGR